MGEQKEKAALALARLATDDDNLVVIARAGGIEALVMLARDGTDGRKEKAALAALARLATDDDNRVAIARAGGINALVMLARDGTEEQKEKAALALAAPGWSGACRARRAGLYQPGMQTP